MENHVTFFVRRIGEHNTEPWGNTDSVKKKKKKINVVMQEFMIWQDLVTEVPGTVQCKNAQKMQLFILSLFSL